MAEWVRRVSCLPYVRTAAQQAGYSCRSRAGSNRFVVAFWRRALCSSVGGQRCWAQLNRLSVRWHERVDITALAIVVPEAERVVAPTRKRHDSSAAKGVPAHITLIIPFVPPFLLDDVVRREVAAVCSHHPPFEFSLRELRRFPHALYLAPSPREPFQRLLRDLVASYPDYPPYEGAFDDYIPHLTIADSEAADSLDQVAVEFTQSHARDLPIACRAEAATLFELREERWISKCSFSLGKRTA